jgi:hypothetical protein
VIFHSKLLEYQRLTDIIDIPRIQSHHVSPSVSFPPQIGGGAHHSAHHGTMAPWHFVKPNHLQDGWSSAWVANVWAATCPRTWKTAISSYRDSRIFWRPVSPPGAAGLAGQMSVAPFFKGDRDGGKIRRLQFWLLKIWGFKMYQSLQNPGRCMALALPR